MEVREVKETNPHKLLTPRAREAANILGLSEGTLMVWRSTGRYNLTYVKVGRRVMYKLSDVIQFIESRTQFHT